MLSFLLGLHFDTFRHKHSPNDQCIHIHLVSRIIILFVKLEDLQTSTYFVLNTRAFVNILVVPKLFSCISLAFIEIYGIQKRTSLGDNCIISTGFWIMKTKSIQSYPTWSLSKIVFFSNECSKINLCTFYALLFCYLFV